MQTSKNQGMFYEGCPISYVFTRYALATNAKCSNQCDERRPTCFQCEKSKRQCPGYLSQLDVMFRNQTDLVARRATKKTQRNDSKQPSPLRLESRTHLATETIEDSTESLLSTITVPPLPIHPSTKRSIATLFP